MNDRLMQSKKSLPKTCITVCPFFQRKLIFHCAFKQNFSPKSPAISVSRPRGRARYACRFIAVCYAKFVVIKESESHNGNMKKCSIEIHRPWRNIHNKMELTSQRLLINTIFMRKRLERFLPLTICFSQKYSLIRAKTRE